MLNERKLQAYHHEHDETKTKIYFGIKKARQGYGN